MEGAFFFFAWASGGRKADCALLIEVCALFFRAAAWRSFSKQGLGVREEVGVLRPWGDLRPAAACVLLEFLLLPSGGLPRGILLALMEGVSLAGGVGMAIWPRSPGISRPVPLVAGSVISIAPAVDELAAFMRL